jgi:Lrp/AsnC family transcriptional regulator for asnA, asnC and gidA
VPDPQETDDIDRRLLSLLRKDARLSARALGREIGMSAGAVSERVSRLEASGAIRGYHAEVDGRAVGYTMRVVVALQTAQGMSLDDTMDALLAAPEVIEVMVVSGQWDFVVLAQVRDHEHLRDLVVGGLWSTPGFRHSETMLVLERRDGEGKWVASD